MHHTFTRNFPQMLSSTIRAIAVGAGTMAWGVLPHDLPAQASPSNSLAPAAYLEDFDAAWTFLRDTYAYFAEKRTDWKRVRELFRPRAMQVRSTREFVGLLEDMIEELYDPHAHLGVNTPSSPRLVPSGTDLWAAWQGDRAVITDVRAGSEAARAGLRPDMEILSIADRPVREVVRSRLPIALSAPDPAANDWALRAALAGRHDAPVRVEIRAGERSVRFEFRPGRTHSPQHLLTAVTLEDTVAYVRIHDALGNTALIAAWDSVLAVLRDTRALVLDLRDTPGGGNSTVARGIMSRLTARERPYQRHELPAEDDRYGVRRLWVEHVAPRGPFTYDKPIAVLVGRWTGSMGEGLAIGLDAMEQVTVIGTPMAGLRGATYGTALPNTRIEVRAPAERLYHIDGTAREDFVPDILVTPGESGAASDRALETALRTLRRR